MTARGAEPETVRVSRNEISAEDIGEEPRGTFPDLLSKIRHVRGQLMHHFWEGIDLRIVRPALNPEHTILNDAGGRP